MLRAQTARSPRVSVLLALYNGARFLEEQLDSIAHQSHENWSLLIRDDGSRDRGVEVAHRFAARVRRDVRIFGGAHLGFARNFMTLLEEADPDTDYAAFCDQDDVWAPDKLSRAVSHLAGLPVSVPAFYCGRTILTDAALTPIGTAPHFKRPTGFKNALVQNIAGGNTMVFNRAALNLLRLAAGYKGDVPAHDWWAYQVVAGAGGIVIYDKEPMVRYRQHDQNLIGSNRGMSARIKRVRALLDGQLCRWSDQNIRALQAISPLLSPGSARTLTEFAELRATPCRERLRRFRSLGLYRQTDAGQAALLAAVALGRI